jgi:DNA mismatch repair protein MutL
MARIHRLPEALIGKIAAGEVVERPASVVKELLENAIDAGAGEIVIELSAGGTARIAVRDDGCGMSEEDARLAFERHATSKIESFEDLSMIGTLGFRGEALAAISAVSRVDLQTSEEDGGGWRVFVEPGAAAAVEPVGRPRGTAIEVSSLFFNVPARREFLKTAPTELRRVLEVVQGYALARPAIRFHVRHEGKSLFDLLPTADDVQGARARITQIFGPTIGNALSEIGLAEKANRIWGFVGDRSTTRGRRYFVFVNRRLIRDRTVMSSFYRAVREVWKGGEFPALFLFVDLPRDEVDVNVHPQKSEVRFLNDRLLHLVYKAVRQTLEGSLGEAPAPVESLGPEADSLSWAPLAWRGSGERFRGSQPGDSRSDVAEPGAESSTGRLAEVAYAVPERTPVPLTGRHGTQRSFRLLGQYKGTVILLEGPDGLYLVDQHVAHERILYERLRSELARAEPQSQRLLEPHLLDLSAAESHRLAEWIPQLAECGFEMADLSGDTVGVIAVPAVLKPKQAEMLLEELARDRQGPGESPGDTVRERVLDALAASMACRSAIKMHEPMSADKMEALVAELFVAEQPYACPHGRPTILKMSDADLERHFGRR